MSALAPAVVPALLAGAAVVVGRGLPGPASSRLAVALPAPTGVRPAWARWPGLLPSGVRLGRLRGAGPAGLAGLLGLLLSGPALAVAGAAVSAAVHGALRRRSSAEASRQERAGAGEACGVLAGELRAGRSAGQALEAAAQVASGPFAARLHAGATAAGFGGDVAAALQSGPPTGVPRVAAGLAACWQVCAGTGSGLAAAVERLEEGLRGEAAARRAVEAELAGPRATASLLATLPVLGVLLAAALGARPLHVLLETPVGGVCLVLGVGLDLLGLAWTRRIARGAEP